MKFVLLSTDLMISSLVAGVARQFDAVVETTRDQAAAVEAAQQEGVRVVVVDLRCQGIAVSELVRQLREVGNADLRVVAFGPHVHEAKLAEARAAGCDGVATRGQFDRDAAEIIAQLVS